MKKILQIALGVLTGTLLFSTTAFADTPVFSDVDETTSEGQAIVKMYNAGILAGYEDGTFKPDGSITRAELVRVFNQVFEYSLDEDAQITDFTDNEDSTAWYYEDVRIAQANGYINGFEDGSFRPKENFTRQQACVVMDLIADLDLPEVAVEISDPVSDWAYPYVNRMLVAGLFTLEDGNTFRATENITRGEVCQLLAIFVDDSTDEDTDDTEVTEEETEVISVTTSNGTVVSVTKGSSGGSSSSSSSSSSKTTTTTTTTTSADSETTTETTTSSSSSNNNTTTTESATETTTETATETTTEAATETSTIVTDTAPEQYIVSALNRVYKNMNKYVVPNCSTTAQKAVAQAITDAIYEYLSDYTYDFTGAAEAAIADYKALESDEKTELRELIVSYNSVSDLLILQEHYFPGLL